VHQVGFSLRDYNEALFSCSIEFVPKPAVNSTWLGINQIFLRSLRSVSNNSIRCFRFRLFV